MELYALLGLTGGAHTDAEIRSAYRRSALQAHPDKGGSEELFHAVLTAFEVLSSRSSRDSYDAALARGMGAAEAVAVATGAKRLPASASAGARARPLARLRQLLAALPRGERQAALQRLAPEVQQALMSFMQEAAPEDANVAQSRERPLALQDGGGSDRRRGILRQGTSPPTYKASVFLPCLFISAKPDPSLENVLQRHAALLRTKELLGRSEAEANELSSSQVQTALVEAFSEASLDADKELQMLTFTAIIPAYYEVGRQIKGRQTSDLAAACELRARLLKARAEGWPELREEWIAIMQQPPEGGQGHRACTAEEAARIADAAWDAGIPARAKAEARRQQPPRRKSEEMTIEDAARAVARALKAEAGPAAKKRRVGGEKDPSCAQGFLGC
ncbi:unnamed protein product [Effrenium voratum]|nr:unnamed protein product [Effrenium voratum]